MKNRKVSKKNLLKRNQENVPVQDPSADQHVDLLSDLATTGVGQILDTHYGAAMFRVSAEMEAERREVIRKLDGSALANRQDLAVSTPALPTNRVVSYPTPVMPSAHFDIKADGKVETLVQPDQRVYVDASHAAWQVNDDGSKTLVQPVEQEYDWSKGVPQFVEDLEAAIEVADLGDCDNLTASQIAAELLKHPALQSYLDSKAGEVASIEFPDCEYAQSGDVDLSEFMQDDPEAAHMSQWERYADQGENMQGEAHNPGVQDYIDATAKHIGVDMAHFDIAKSVGDVPSEQEFLGNVAEGEARWERRRPQLIAQAKAGIAALQELAGMAAEHKGFHEDRPVSGAELQNWQGNKLMLIVSEAVEAHDEIRSGQKAWNTYYPTWDEEQSEEPIPGKHKPEGVPSEIADVVIRSADFAWTEGFDLAEIIIEKLEFNATRGYKHGKAF